MPPFGSTLTYKAALEVFTVEEDGETFHLKRPTLNSKNFWSMYSCLYVCLPHVSGRRNYSICFKGTNVYLLREISCTVFAVHCPNSACTEIHKIFSIHYGLWLTGYTFWTLRPLFYISTSFFIRIPTSFHDTSSKSPRSTWFCFWKEVAEEFLKHDFFSKSHTGLYMLF